MTLTPKIKKQLIKKAIEWYRGYKKPVKGMLIFYIPIANIASSQINQHLNMIACGFNTHKLEERSGYYCILVPSRERTEVGIYSLKF